MNVSLTFSVESDGEIIVSIGVKLAKLWAIVWRPVSLTHGIYWGYEKTSPLLFHD